MAIDIKSFLMAAKRTTYAGQDDDATVTPLLPDSKQLEYSAGEFLYRDIYVGLFRFVGQEIVYIDGHARWSMSYSGGLCADTPRSSARAIYAFVRKALRAMPADLPLRGPTRLADDGMVYTCQSEGLIDRFHGIETIVDANARLYELHFSGGMLA